MRFSLINTHRTEGRHVIGTWIQDVVGSKEQAETRARETEKANGSGIKVSVTEPVVFGSLDGPNRARLA